MLLSEILCYRRLTQEQAWFMVVDIIWLPWRRQWRCWWWKWWC